MPRRATTHRSGDGSPIFGVLALLIIIGLIPVAVWYFHPFDNQVDIPVVAASRSSAVVPALQPLAGAVITPTRVTVTERTIEAPESI